MYAFIVKNVEAFLASLEGFFKFLEVFQHFKIIV